MTVFLTGFPGFLGSALVERLLDRDETVACLVQSHYREQAEQRAADLAGPDWAERIGLYEGDITEPELGLADDVRASLAESVTEVFHLAAIYDLGVDRAPAEAVNVRGTEHVLDFAESVAALDRFQYVSTCYVSGRYDGLFGEDDLDVGQSFNNHYERTKFEAEVAVQERMADGLPATVYRPAITVGDSQTGATQKFDGPYYLLQWIRRQPSLAVVPRLPGHASTTVNVVPRDFVVDAIDYLSTREASVGAVHHLCDPNPPTVAEMLAAFAEAAETRVLPIPTTESLATWLLDLGPVREVAGIEPETVPYFVHPTRYTCGSTRRALAGSGIEAPPFGSYVDALVSFADEHPDVSPDAMV